MILQVFEDDTSQFRASLKNQRAFEPHGDLLTGREIISPRQRSRPKWETAFDGRTNQFTVVDYRPAALWPFDRCEKRFSS